MTRPERNIDVEALHEKTPLWFFTELKFTAERLVTEGKAKPVDPKFLGQYVVSTYEQAGISIEQDLKDFLLRGGQQTTPTDNQAQG